MNNINYKQIYEEELTSTIKDSLEKPRFFGDLSHQDRMMVEELVDIGFRRAIEDVLDPEVVSETAALAGEMGTQLYHFANLLQQYMGMDAENTGDET